MKEPLRKEYALMSPLIWHCRTSQSNLWWKEIRMLLASWGGGRDWRGSGTRELSGVMVNVPHTGRGLGYTHVQLSKHTEKYSFGSVHFIVQEFHLNKKSHEVWIILTYITIKMTYVWEFRMKWTDVCDLTGNASKIRYMDERSTDTGQSKYRK